ncbi:MAG: hypothetical protein HZA61_08840 [Candidatus Eisenbacteria bacterium]|uniref:Uncharacterized protein n=1 Tax=Eiseniibacteriota bacterium TaxID=2212470 RepID=A0A933SE30_UNCEI|nr:hypothetical protein [Candidatus Eisenbacteria bacterium]
MPVIQKLYENTMVGDPPQITVKFNLVGLGPATTWSITPDSLTMHGNGQIQFVLDPASSAGTSFVGFAIKATSPNPNNGTFDNINVVQNGQRMNVNDHDNTPKGGLPMEFDYMISVVNNGTTYYSDPKIINDPPPNMYRAVPAKALETA